MSAPILKISGMDISIDATDISTNMRMQDKLEIIAKKLERIPYRSRIYLFSEKTRDFWKELSWISDIPETHIIQFLKEKIDNDQSDKEIEYMVEIIRIDRLENPLLHILGYLLRRVSNHESYNSYTATPNSKRHYPAVMI